MIQRRRLERRLGLPEGYTQLDWIEADSTQAPPEIMSSYQLPYNFYNINSTYLKFETKFARTINFPSSSGSIKALFGSANSIYQYGVHLRNTNYNRVYFVYASQSANEIVGNRGILDMTIAKGTWYNLTLEGFNNALDTDGVYRKNGGILTIDSNVGIWDSTQGRNFSENPGSITLFKNNGNNYCLFARLAEFKVTNNRTRQLEVWLIPAMRDSDSVIGMYDVVRQEFLTPSADGVTLLGGYGFEDF